MRYNSNDNNYALRAGVLTSLSLLEQASIRSHTALSKCSDRTYGNLFASST